MILTTEIQALVHRRSIERDSIQNGTLITAHVIDAYSLLL